MNATRQAATDFANAKSPAFNEFKFFTTGEQVAPTLHSRAAEQPSEKSTCHPERRMRASVVEAVGRERSEPSKRRGATATKGSRNEFGWLSIGNVTFPMNG